MSKHVRIRNRTLRLENLENRQLMAVAPFAALTGGILTDAQFEQVAPGPQSIPKEHELPLHSKPGAPASLFLDFNGHFQRETFGDILGFGGWKNILTPAFDRDNNPNMFSPEEQQEIRFIWAAVAEDFAPFNLNVTTVDPDPGNLHPERPYLRVVISGSHDFTGGDAAGVAESDGFGRYNSYADPNDPNVVYVFSRAKNGHHRSVEALAQAASHEAGHAFGNNHFDDAGTAKRGPIMAENVLPNATERITWSNKEQDEMKKIASSDNGFGYRPDDHGNSFASASALIPTNAGLFGRGIIEKTTDLDVFTFTTGGGQVAVNLSLPTERTTPKRSPVNVGNLDATLKLFNAGGGLIAQDTNPGLLAGLTANLAAGKYFVQVGSFGTYGDVGQYSILVTENQGPRVMSSQAHELSATTAAVYVTFNEPVHNLTFTPIDVRVNNAAPGAGVLSVAPVAGSNLTRYVVHVNRSLSPTGAWSISIGPHIKDLFGNSMDQNRNGISGEAADQYFRRFLNLRDGTLDPLVTTTTTATSNITRVRAPVTFAADAVFQNFH